MDGTNQQQRGTPASAGQAAQPATPVNPAAAVAFELIEQGKPSEALARVQEQARVRPADASVRVLLFELYSMLGQWDRALSHAEVAVSLTPDAGWLKSFAPGIVTVERKREAALGGSADLDLLGEPEPWSGLLVQAQRCAAKGDLTEASNLRAQALTMLPDLTGTINGTPFKFLSDADPRFGPMLEVYIAGAYLWLPLTRVSKIDVSPPRRIMDRVWISANLTLSTGGNIPVILPARYPGSEDPPVGPPAAASATEWEPGPGSGSMCFGRGQRLLVTDTLEVPLLEAATIEIHSVDPAQTPGGGAT